MNTTNMTSNTTNMTSNNIKGTSYEYYIHDLLNLPTENKAWLWKFVPETNLRESGILGNWNEFRLLKKAYKEENPFIDIGIDILLKKDNDYFIVQCKNYNTNNYVTIDKLAGFYHSIVHYQLKGMVYYTSKLSTNLLNAKPNNNIEFIKETFKDETEYTNNLLLNKEFVASEKNMTNLIDTPFDYQIEATIKLKDVFIGQNKYRAVLQLPCGLGKTLISMIVGLNFNQVIIVSPLKEYCIQNLDRFKSEVKYNNYKELLIDTDGTRDLDEIKDFIKNNNKILFSVCYKSCDILSKILSNLNNYLIIFDEFHNISKNDIMGLNETGIYDILNSDSKILFMSATPKIYCLDKDEDDNEELNKDIFGEIEYKIEMSNAIKNKQICDYELYIPDIQLNNQPFIDDIKKEININHLNNDINIKCNFILRGLLTTGSNKTIIYVRTHEEAYNFKESLTTLNNYFYMDLSIDTILSSDNKQKRLTKLNNFKSFNGFSLIISVDILNECIDIPSCDSIFITYPTTSKIKIIQRICRANRKDKYNPDKISKIFIWTDIYEDMTDIILNLKEFDADFLNNKVNILSLNNNKNQILNRNQNNEKIYEILDNFIISIKKVLSWNEKFESLKKYIDDNGYIPSQHSKDINIKCIGAFFYRQQYNYDKKIKMMRHQKYYDIWTLFKSEYNKNIINIEERWILILEKVIQFIEINKKSPSRYNVSDDDEDYTFFDLNKFNIEQNLGNWLSSQKKYLSTGTKMFSYKLENNNKVYNHPKIIEAWNNFSEKYKIYLLNNEENWEYIMQQLKNYIDTYKKKPSTTSKDESTRKLGIFISTQKKNHKIKAQIMSNPIYYNKWTIFTQEYSSYLLTVEDKWYDILDNVKNFIDKNKKRPNKHSSNKDEKVLGEWLVKQSGKYKNNKMNNDEINETYELFLQEYQQYI